MKKKLLALAIGAAVAAPMAAQAQIQQKWFGFAQLKAEYGTDSSVAATGGLGFGADRVRIGYKLKDGNVSAKLQVDFNKDGASSTGYDLPATIKDMAASYKAFGHKFTIGQFKTPVGMDFNTSGKKLDITKRGMEKKLVFERAAGFMVSGKAGAITYDLFMGNPAVRSKLVTISGKPNNGTIAYRVGYNMGKQLHVEVSGGTTGSCLGADAAGLCASGKDASTSVFDIAAKYKMGAMTFKLENISATGIKGGSENASTLLLHAGYMLNKKTELVARYYGASTNKTGSDSSASNIYLGGNLFLGSNKTNGRLQINYVISHANSYTGTNKGYTENMILSQYQVSF